MDQVAHQLSNNQIIEFKGSYYRKHSDQSVVVLVQFDGVLLHVWHLADPFHRILSCDAFRLTASVSNGRRCIKLSNGDRVVTADTPAVQTLWQQHADSRGAGPRLLKPAGLVAALSFITIGLAVWWFSRKGFLF